MKKKNILLLLGLSAALALCTYGQTLLAEDVEVEFESEHIIENSAVDRITPSDYLIENASDYVTLCDLKNLPVTEYTYEITDDMVSEAIDSELMYYTEEVPVDRAAQEGDIIYMTMTSSIQGQEASEVSEDTYLTLGYEEYGPEMDAQLLGMSAGESAEFSVTFDDTFWNPDWADQTVDFKITVTDVCEQVTPELNDEFVKENTGCETTDEYFETMRDQLKSEYADSFHTDAMDELIMHAIDSSSFNGYPEELYDACKDEVVSYYAMFAGTDDPEEICELFGISEEDLDADVMIEVNLRLLLSAICQQEGLEVSEEDYLTFLLNTALEYGYENPAEFEEENGRDAIVWAIYQNLIGDFLYENADVSTAEYVMDEAEEWEEIDPDFLIEDESDAEFELILEDETEE